jgi:sugar transferase (PEP-CTERM/EpsH1 system associated)
MASRRRQEVLLLCHRIPYPPDKGDKIRSYQWLLALSGCCRVSLVAFVDDPDDWTHETYLKSCCAELLLVPLKLWKTTLGSLNSLIRARPLTEGYYRNDRVFEWVMRWKRKNQGAPIVAFSSAMAQYIVDPKFCSHWRVVDFVDVDSDKWQQYAERMRGPKRWLYSREARRLKEYELDVARAVDLSVFVAQSEAALFSAGCSQRLSVDAVTNGVDAQYFAPACDRLSPYGNHRRVAVFTGSMDYWANVDAVRWFVANVWPTVVSRYADAVFYIVGARPTAQVRALVNSAIVVTGRVGDVRPYLQHAAVIVAPMQIARGIQNKVLEGMAMARPVVVTPRGLEGLEAEDGEDVLVAADGPAFSRRVVEALDGVHDHVGSFARQRVCRDYDWDRVRQRFRAAALGHGEECRDA